MNSMWYRFISTTATILSDTTPKQHKTEMISSSPEHNVGVIIVSRVHNVFSRHLSQRAVCCGAADGHTAVFTATTDGTLKKWMVNKAGDNFLLKGEFFGHAEGKEINGIDFCEATLRVSTPLYFSLSKDELIHHYSDIVPLCILSPFHSHTSVSQTSFDKNFNFVLFTVLCSLPRRARMERAEFGTH